MGTMFRTLERHCYNIPIEDSYVDISQEEIKKANKQNERRAQKKRVDPWLHMLSSFYNFVPKFLL